MPFCTDRSERLNCFSTRKLLPLSHPSSYHAWVKVLTKEWVCPPVSIHPSMSRPDPRWGNHTVVNLLQLLSSLLLCLLLTTLHPNRHLATMSGHKLLSSMGPNYCLSIRCICTKALQSGSNNKAQCLIEGINTVISGPLTVRDVSLLQRVSSVHQFALHYRDLQYQNTYAHP